MSLRLSNGLRLLSPPGDRARPTAGRVREALFNQLRGALTGRRWLDLCCGSGAMGCEALLQGAERVLAVELDRRTAAVARRNLASLGEAYSGRWRVLTADVLHWLKRAPGDGTWQAFDLVYADPPYRSELYGPLLSGLQNNGWLSARGRVWLEAGSDRPPCLPAPWQERQRRRYGSSLLLEVSLPQAGTASAAEGAAPPAVLIPGGNEQAEQGDGDQTQNDAAEQGFDHGAGSERN
jgi:16S rRNA (guanine966-N2)-methyltransferase